MAINPIGDGSGLEIAPESLPQVKQAPEPTATPTPGAGQVAGPGTGPVGALTPLDDEQQAPEQPAEPQPGSDEYERSPPTEGKQAVAQQIAQVWKARGWSDAAIHGGLANALDESNLSNAATGGAGEQGIFQFNPVSHLGPYMEFARNIGASPGNYKAQADYVGDWVDKHMQGYGQSTDPHTATDWFMHGFEAPKDQTPGRRFPKIAEAQQLYPGGFQVPQALAQAAQQGRSVAMAIPGGANFSDAASPLTQRVLAAATNSQPSTPQEQNAIGPFSDLPAATRARPSGPDSAKYILDQDRSGSYMWRPINPDTGGGAAPGALNPMQSPIGSSQGDIRNQVQNKNDAATSSEGMLGHMLWNILGPESMAKGLSTVLGMGHDLPQLANDAADAVYHLFGGKTSSGFTDPNPPKNDLNSGFHGGLIPSPEDLLPGAKDVLPIIHSVTQHLGMSNDWQRNFSTNSWDRASDFAGNFLWSNILGGGIARLAGGMGGALSEMPKVGPALWSSLKSIGAGMGLGEVNDALDSMNPTMHPFWHSLSLMGAGTGFNLARMAAFTAAEKAVTGGSKVIKSITSTTPDTLNHEDPYFEQGARNAINETLAKHAYGTVWQAQDDIAKLGVPVASEGGMTPAAANQARRDLDLQANVAAQQSLRRLRTGAQQTEQQLWSLVPHDERDYSGFQGAFNTLRAGEKQVPGALKEDFPHDLAAEALGQPEPIRSVGALMDPSGIMAPALASELSGLSGEVGLTGGLRTVDSLANGRTMLDNLNQRLGQALSVDKPNLRLTGHLQDLKSALLSDLGQGPSSPALLLAKAYSREWKDLSTSPEMKRAMGGGPTDMAALRNFLSTGPTGATGVQSLNTAAQQRYGQPGLLNAYQDMVRRTYVDRVAPNGLVDSAAHTQFMGPSGFGSALAHPAMSGIREELNAAGDSGRMLDKLADPNTPAGLPTSYKQRAAALENWMGQPVDTALKYMFQGNNPRANTETVLNRLAADPTGKAPSGLQALVAEKAINEAGGIGVPLAAWAAKSNNAGVLAAMGKADPSFADRFNFVTNPTGSKLFLETMAKIPGAWMMARLGNTLAEGGGVGSSMLLAGRFAKLSDIATNRLFASTVAKVTGATIADPERFAQWQKGLNVSGAARQFRNWGSSIINEAGHPWLKYVPGIAGNSGADPDNPDPHAMDWLRASGAIQ